MNFPSITCYLTKINDQTVGLPHEIDLINSFRKLGYEPLVNGIMQPPRWKLLSAHNSIAYIWKDLPGTSTKQLVSIPAEQTPANVQVAALQTHPKYISPFNRTLIGNYLIQIMTTNERPISKRLSLLAEQGCFSIPVTMLSNEVNEPRHVIIENGVEKDGGKLSDYVEQEFLKFFNK